jgi:NADPH:quinone reductase-like Zn-dependent oxidoreductase
MKENSTMEAMVIANYGGPEQLVRRDIPTPVAQDGEVLIKVRAFGINRAETYMRRGEWPEIAPVSGIECVGEVEHDPSGRLAPGQKVAAIMGGMGRTRNGSYAELVSAPATNVVPLETALEWEDLAAIPESYATAWICLFHNLRLARGDVLLVRGGTSALGQAAINIAVHAGATVLASTRSGDNRQLLTDLGAARILIENGQLGEVVREEYPGGIDTVLELVGNSTVLDSLSMVRRGGRVCVAGFLGGGEPIAFNPLLQMPSGVDLSFFGSFVLGTPEFPVAEVPLQEIVARAERGEYRARPAKVFRFEEIPDAHRLMESNTARGKIVVTAPIGKAA